MLAIAIKEKINLTYNFEELSNLEPTYLRKSQAEINFEKNKKNKTILPYLLINNF